MLIADIKYLETDVGQSSRIFGADNPGLGNNQQFSFARATSGANNSSSNDKALPFDFSKGLFIPLLIGY